MGDVTNILLALRSENPQIRVPAEQQVYVAREQDLAGFLIALVREARDETKPSHSRQMALMLLKNSIDARDEQRKSELDARWRAIDTNIREQVKAEVLATVASTDKDVRRIVALVIANLARIELPRNEWPGLLETLIGACSSNDSHTEAALTALGYICEESNNCEPLAEVLQQFSAPILNAVTTGMARPNADVQLCATNALCNSMEFISPNMQVDNERNFLMGAICTTVRSAPNELTRERAMQCLVKVAFLYYKFLGAYMEDLFEVTIAAARKDTELVALQALQFWSCVCDTEKEMRENGREQPMDFSKHAAKPLSELLCELLLKQVEYQTDEDWNVSIAASKALMSLAEAIGNPIVELIMPYVYSKINLPNWRDREAACMAFGCVLNGPDSDMMKDTVAQAVPGLLQYFQDPNFNVADTAGWTLATVAENEVFVEVLLAEQALPNLLNVLIPALAAREQERSSRACQVIHNICLHFEGYDEDETSNDLSPHYSRIVQAIVQTMDRTDAMPKLRLETQETLNALISAAATDSLQILRELVPNILNRLEQTVHALRSGAFVQDIVQYQTLLCGALNHTTRKLSSGIGPVAPSIMNALLTLLQSSEMTVQDEALQCVGAVASAIGPAFEEYLAGIRQYVIQGLQAVDDEKFCTVAIGVVGDIVSALRDRSAALCHDAMNVYLEKLRDENVDRDIKTVFIASLGDVAVNLESNFGQYLSTFMEVVQGMDQLSRTLNISDDYDNEDFVMSLWESTCEFFTGVLQGFKGNGEVVLPYVSGILEFVSFASRRCRNFEDCFRACVVVIGDAANFVVNSPVSVIRKMKPVVLDRSLIEVIEEGFRSQDDSTREQAKWSEEQMRALDQCR